MRAEDYFSQLRKLLGIEFHDRKLLLKALTHRSYVNEHRAARELGHYELLEFLGDAVIELVVTDFLVRNHSDKTEGELTKLRSGLVCGRALSEVTVELGIINYVRMSRGQRKDVRNLERTTKLFADVLEAVVGAIYQDRGLMAAQSFVLEMILPRLQRIFDRSYTDFVSIFQEQIQGLGKPTPTYSLVSEEGPDHERTYTEAVYVGSTFYAIGTGLSRKEARKDAAKNALAMLNPPT